MFSIIVIAAMVAVGTPVWGALIIAALLQVFISIGRVRRADQEAAESDG